LIGIEQHSRNLISIGHFNLKVWKNRKEWESWEIPLLVKRSLLLSILKTDLELLQWTSDSDVYARPPKHNRKFYRNSSWNQLEKFILLRNLIINSMFHLQKEVQSLLSKK